MTIKTTGERIFGFIFGLFVGVIFTIVGGLMLFVFSPQQENEWRAIDNLADLTPTVFANTPAGESVIFTGQLSGNSANEYGLVAYKAQHWDVDRGDDGEQNRGTWVTDQYVLPAISVDFGGFQVYTTEGGTPVISGDLHETIIADGSSNQIRARHNSDYLYDGATRVIGFMEKDLITVYGVMNDSGAVIPERLFGGDREGLMKEIKLGTRIIFFMGLAFFIIGPVIGIIAAINSLTRRN